jgi:hypothetical protein
VRFRRALLLVFLPVLMAATQRELALEELVDLSSEIVVGRVVGNEARWEGKLIFTVTTVEVEEALKGAGGSPRVEVTQLGGTASHPRTGLAMTMSASTFAPLESGQQVLLFLHRGRTGARGLVGAQQGRMLVRENPATKQREIPVGSKRLDVHRAPGGADEVAVRAMTLDAMRARIRARVEGKP